MVTVGEEEILPDAPKYWPLCVVGTTEKATNFEESSQEIEDSQIVRVGFCNREHRLLVQTKTTHGVNSLRANDALRPGTYLLVISFDNVENKIKLYVDGRLVQEAELNGQLQLRPNDNLWFGHGDGCQVWFCHIFRTQTNPSSSLLNDILPPPIDSSGWIQKPDAINRLYSIGEQPANAASLWFSRHFIWSVRSNSSEALRLFRLFEKNADIDTSNDQLVREVVATSIRTITDGLEAIVVDETKSEIDLLRYFQEQPATAILLETSIYRQWREQEIQKYGRIDFVFELIDGTFLVVEIESHTKKLFTMQDEFTQPFRHAVEQVVSWIRGIGKLPHIARRIFGSDEQDAYQGLVVIGKKSEICNSTRTERWLAEKAKTPLLTWDDLIARGRLLEQRMRDPALDDYTWESSDE